MNLSASSKSSCLEVARAGSSGTRFANTQSRTSASAFVRYSLRMAVACRRLPTTPLLPENLAPLAVPGVPGLAESFFFFKTTIWHVL